MRPHHALGALTLLAVAVVAQASCQQVIDIPDRKVRANVVCASGSCTCTTGFGDCDENLANGCEVDLTTDQNNCGMCGSVCANGMCAESKCACNAGYADCDANLANGCEVNLAMAPTDCGTCGHDCQGGGCAASLCTPVVLATEPSPAALVLDAGNLYFLDFDGTNTLIHEVAATGGAEKTVAVVPDALTSLAVVGSVLFAGSTSKLYRIDTAAHMTSIVTTLPAGMGIQDVVASPTTVFVLELPNDTSPGEIVAFDPTSLTMTTVSTDVDSGNFTLTLAKGEPVWIDTSQGASTVVGGVATKIQNSPTPVIDLAGDDAFIWALTFTNTLVVTRIDATTNAMVPGNNVVPSSYGSLAGIGTTLAWSSNGFLDAWDGTTITRLAQNVNVVSRMAIDTKAIYAANDQNQVVRVAR